MKKNLKFFAKLIAIMCSVAILIGIANLQYVTGYYYTDVYGEVKKFENVPNHITFANFGTSHGLAAFRYDENDKQSFNFALSGEDIYHDFQTLKQFSDHLEKGCIVTIPVSYFSFCLSTDEPSQKRYYTYLDKQYIRDFSYETLINTKYLPVLRSIEFLFKDIIGDQEINSENFMDDPNAASFSTFRGFSDMVVYADDTVSEEQKIQQLKDHADFRSESWRSGRMVLGKAYLDDNTKILCDMINYCYDNGFRPVLITIPVYQALTEDFTEEELEYYYFSRIDKVVDSTGIEYIDYSRDKRLINQPEYYNNSDHMSETGGNAFLEIYKNDLKDKGFAIK